jgi:cytochrome o ubiquinol oxidase subunit 1
MKMPVFTWTALCTNALIVASFPVLTALWCCCRWTATSAPTSSRTTGRQPHAVREPDLDLGPPRGLHPDPAGFGVFSEIVDVQPQASVRLHLDGVRHRVYHHPVLPGVAAPLLHHGLGRQREYLLRYHHDDHLDPTGAKIFNWLFTMYRGRIRFSVPMLWTVGFMVTFAIGGMTGVLLAVPPADFVLHNSPVPDRPLPQRDHRRRGVWRVCRHQLLVPQGFRLPLNEFWGKASFWCWLVGFWVSPLYILGLMGVTRRANHFDDPRCRSGSSSLPAVPLLIAAGIGAASSSWPCRSGSATNCVT